VYTQQVTTELVLKPVCYTPNVTKTQISLDFQLSFLRNFTVSAAYKITLLNWYKPSIQQIFTWTYKNFSQNLNLIWRHYISDIY